MSTKFDASELYRTFGKEVNIEKFVHKAVSNAYNHVMKEACSLNQPGHHAISVS